MYRVFWGFGFRMCRFKVEKVADVGSRSRRWSVRERMHGKAHAAVNEVMG